MKPLTVGQTVLAVLWGMILFNALYMLAALICSLL